MKRIVPLLLSFLMFVGVFPIVSVSAQSGDSVEHTVMSFAGEALQKETGVVQYAHPRTKAGSGWKYANVDGVDCMALTFFDNGDDSSYMIMPKFSDENMIPRDMKYARLVFMTTEPGNHMITLSNSYTEESVVLVTDTYVSGGKWMTSVPVEIASCGITERFADGLHNTIEFSAEHEGAQIYLKEMVFFRTEDDAYAYYDSDTVSSVDIVPNPLSLMDDEIVWDFSSEANMQSKLSIDNNVTSVSEVSHNGVSALKINYTEKHSNFLFSFSTAKKTMAEFGDGDYYMAVTYMTDSEGSLIYKLGSHAEEGDSMGTLSGALKASEGFTTVVYGTNEAPKPVGRRYLDVIKTGKYTHPERGLISTRLQFVYKSQNKDANFFIKEVVFFDSPEEARLYASKAPAFYNAERAENNATIRIGDTPIGNYRVVIGKDSNKAVLSAAELFVSHLSNFIGRKLEIVTDSAAPAENEILIGKTNRAESQEFYGRYAVYGADNAADADLTEYSIKVINGKLVFASGITLGIRSAVDVFTETYLHQNIMGDVKISESFSLTGITDDYTAKATANTFTSRVNVPNPTVVTEDFSLDNGLFTEEDGRDHFKYENGAFTSKASDELALSYIHVYDYNTAFEADFSYDNAVSDAVMGITLRYTGEDGYIRAGYDFANGEWYIDTKEGYDFECYRVASSKAELNANEVYRLSATVDENTTVLSVNGTELLRSDVTTQTSPGRVGVYSDGVDVSCDNAVLTLLSGEGTVLRNVTHTILNKDAVNEEGATPLILKDGTILVTRSSSNYYKSVDGGVTFTKTDNWTDYNGKPSVLRLADGDWIKIVSRTVDGVKYMACATSADDGKTWADGGLICTAKHDETGKSIGNMNDMVFEMANGRIFTSMTYSESSNTDKWYNFVIFYYSDDKGMTWHKSLDSRYIEGNEETTYFAESKMIQCADGRIRMMNSWNNFGCIVYCDSFDNGETWGALQTMDAFTCNRSSLAIARDLYAQTDNTYYMVWCYDIPQSKPSPLPRTRLALAKTTDGITWEYLGDVWRWEYADSIGPNPSGGNCTLIAQIVDPAVNVTEDGVIVCAGISEYCYGSYTGFHNVQRQNVWTVKKDTLPDGKILNRFRDVDAGMSFNDAVSYAVDNGLFNGMSDTAFEPHTTMNRAMFVTVLGRLEKVDAEKFTNVSFVDVKAGSWYAPYVEWASSSGVVAGMGDGTYGVEGNITVEQACLMLYRYSDGKQAAEKNGLTVEAFADGGDVADWAADGVKWAISNGIYEGQGGLLNPTAPASRALVATMFYNYTNIIK